jgi:hypothetical protein
MVEEVPDAVVADFDPAFAQLGQEFATSDVGLLRDPSSYPRPHASPHWRVERAGQQKNPLSGLLLLQRIRTAPPRFGLFHAAKVVSLGLASGESPGLPDSREQGNDSGPGRRLRWRARLSE